MARTTRATGVRIGKRQDGSEFVEGLTEIEDAGLLWVCVLLDMEGKKDRFFAMTRGELQAALAAAVKACGRDTLDALELARNRIETYHRRQLPRDDDADRHPIRAVGGLVLVGQVGIKVVRRHLRSLYWAPGGRVAGDRSFASSLVDGGAGPSVEVDGSWSGAKPSESS